MSKPSLPQGTRDFGPEVVRKRNFIFNTIRAVFELFGFQPLETPAFENLETLIGKYGEEGDKLMFRILNNGLHKVEKPDKLKDEFEKILQGKNASTITERALRYDLTIPFARFIAMNHSQLIFPFKRYQIQPVWRADRPQKGRYREFYQCDADVVGSKSLMNEIEFIQVYQEVFKRLQISGCQLHINHRKILRGIMEICRLEQMEKTILIIIDKTDKIGVDGVREELIKQNIPSETLKMLLDIYSFQGTNTEILNFLKARLLASVIGMEGISDIEFVIEKFNQLNVSGIDPFLHLDLNLARGLEYYTGIIFEAKAPSSVKIGSIGGGGRYDDLTGLFGVPNIPGVGISFGVDRIYDVMEELKIFPPEVGVSTQVLFFNLGPRESDAAFSQLVELRNKGIRCELYHESAKFDKQFRYAEKKNIPYVAIIGSQELEQKTCVVKDIRNGQQQTVPMEELKTLRFE